MSKIRVAVAGVGNCCSALVQGVGYWNNNGKSLTVLDELEGRHSSVADVQFVAAFDIDKRKVGKPLNQAIFAEPNNFGKLCDVPDANVTVLKGPTRDGTAGSLRDLIRISKVAEADVADVLKRSKADILVNMLPTLADRASKFYANAALKSKCGFINATPSPIACDATMARHFEEACVPLAGDDVMSQIGGTIFHKNILEFLTTRGVKVTNTYQLDVGGGMETYNTLQPRSRSLKRDIKTNTIKSALNYDANIVAGTTDYVDFLKNSRTSYYWIAGNYFLNTPVEIDIYLRTVDGPNSAAIVLDAIRAVKLAKERGIGGLLHAVCDYGFKMAPPNGRRRRPSTEDARRLFLGFMAGERDN